jgi:broad specificity phosphatase PhoE
MGMIYVVRHAQAAFGADDYDRLTRTGFEQARLLGAYFGLRQIRFDAVYTGSLRRHAETAQGIFDQYLKAGDTPPLQGIRASSAQQARACRPGAYSHPSCDPCIYLIFNPSDRMRRDLDSHWEGPFLLQFIEFGFL